MEGVHFYLFILMRMMFYMKEIVLNGFKVFKVRTVNIEENFRNTKFLKTLSTTGTTANNKKVSMSELS